MLEEEQRDEDGEEEGDGEVLVERPHCGPVWRRREGEDSEDGNRWSGLLHFLLTHFHNPEHLDQ